MGESKMKKLVTTAALAVIFCATSNVYAINIADILKEVERYLEHLQQDLQQQSGGPQQAQSV